MSYSCDSKIQMKTLLTMYQMQYIVIKNYIALVLSFSILTHRLNSTSRVSRDTIHIMYCYKQRYCIVFKLLNNACGRVNCSALCYRTRKNPTWAINFQLLRLLHDLVARHCNSNRWSVSNRSLKKTTQTTHKIPINTTLIQLAIAQKNDLLTRLLTVRFLKIGWKNMFSFILRVLYRSLFTK